MESPGAPASTRATCEKKANRPPGEATRTEAAKLLSAYEDHDVVVSLETYQALVESMSALESTR